MNKNYLIVLLIICLLITSFIFVGCEGVGGLHTEWDYSSDEKKEDDTNTGDLDEKVDSNSSQKEEEENSTGNNNEPNKPTDPKDTTPKEPNKPTDPKDTTPKEPSKPTDPKDTTPKEPSKPTDPKDTTPKEPSKPADPKDTTPPVISGITDISIEFGASFNVLSGVTSTDNADGNITSKIVVSGTVNTNKAGTYTLTYTVSDKAGNKTTEIRKIIVKPSPFVYNADLTNKVRAHQKSMRYDFDKYSDYKGEKVSFFDGIFNNFKSGKNSASATYGLLANYKWSEPIYYFENTEAISQYYIPSLYLDVKEGETKSSDINSLLRSIGYSNNSDYNRIAIYTNAEGVNKVYAIWFLIY